MVLNTRYKLVKYTLLALTLKCRDIRIRNLDSAKNIAKLSGSANSKKPYPAAIKQKQLLMGN